MGAKRDCPCGQHQRKSVALVAGATLSILRALMREKD